MNAEDARMSILARIGVCFQGATYWSFVIAKEVVITLIFIAALSKYASSGVAILEKLTAAYAFARVLDLLLLSSPSVVRAVSDLLSLNSTEVEYLGKVCKKSSDTYVIVASLAVVMILLAIAARTFANSSLMELHIITLMALVASTVVYLLLVQPQCFAKCSIYALIVSLPYTFITLPQFGVLQSILTALTFYDVMFIITIMIAGVRECLSARSW